MSSVYSISLLLLWPDYCSQGHELYDVSADRSVDLERSPSVLKMDCCEGG